MGSALSGGPLYLGFDCSTQGLTALIIRPADRTVLFRHAIEFDAALPEFGTVHGVLPSPRPGVVHAPPLMWKAALHAMFERIEASGIDRVQIRAISGSAQQHGSVYCGADVATLTRATAPVWLDSSSERECAEIAQALGDPMRVAEITGSRAYPRFTGPQIRKFAREEAHAYAITSRIHLVSSYLASLLVGAHAPIDHADASGMNLMDLRTRTWSAAALQATADDLERRLPPLVASNRVVGTLDEIWQRAYDFPAAAVVAWSGDNPCSLVGTGLLHEGQLAISLGTSDTIFGPMDSVRVSRDGTGHVFASPLGKYMGITVFSNGSLARKRVRDDCGLDWNGFSEALRATRPGNDGAMMLPWFVPEITPLAPGSPHYFGLDPGDHRRCPRAIVESQMMALANHSAWMGITPRTVYATGGAAANPDILQVMADVFDADVLRFESTDSAALGAALRAFEADTGAPWDEVVEGFASRERTSTITPIRSNVDIYRRLRPLYSRRELSALAGRGYYDGPQPL